MPPPQQIREEIDQSDDPRASKGRGWSKLSIEMATVCDLANCERERKIGREGMKSSMSLRTRKPIISRSKRSERKDERADEGERC